jgi:hypothetical protein
MKIMRIVALSAILTTGVAGLVGSALAADMAGAEIKGFLSGKTTYLETTSASASGVAGNVAIFWGDDGKALYKTPTGAIMHGTWEIKGTRFAPSGKNGRTPDAYDMTRREMSSR